MLAWIREPQPRRLDGPRQMMTIWRSTHKLNGPFLYTTASPSFLGAQAEPSTKRRIMSSGTHAHFRDYASTMLALISSINLTGLTVIAPLTPNSVRGS